MNRIVVFYNPFLPELKITVNGRRISSYSALMSYHHQRLEKWCDRLFTELHREVNSDYEVVCVSNAFTCEWLGTLARKDPHCLSFTCQPLPMDANVYERLGKLELLGCGEESENIVIPVINASDDEGMTEALYEILEEQGVFENDAPGGMVWYDCPLVNVELRTCRSGGTVPYGIPFAIALCSREEDSVNVHTDAPVYVLVMGTRTEFIRRQGGKLVFRVDPDDIGKLILDILEEEALCPLLSQLSYHFPSEAMAVLTEREKEELELICHVTPLCRVAIPKICDLGRLVPLALQIFPGDCNVPVRIVSDDPTVLTVENGVLKPIAAGSAEIAIYIGEDPYPAAAELVKVCQRKLITGLQVFPSVLYLPEGGSSRPEVTAIPEDAENLAELLWQSSDPSVAEVDSRGFIRAKRCGRCRITVGTQEVSQYVSLEVQPEMEDILCPCSYLELGTGEQKEWRYRVVPENAFGADTLRIMSTDKNIAEYRGGFVIGKGIGECRIFIRNQDGSISRELRVMVKRSRRGW